MQQALLNLLGNACKFTEQGVIGLEVRREDKHGEEWLGFCVHDTGIGMSPEQLTTLFQPFIQADASTTRKYGGTGLGVALSQRFCQMLGGEIRVQSAPGRGSTFTMWLPVESQALQTPHD